MTKRVHYPVNKEEIAKAIYWCMQYEGLENKCTDMAEEWWGHFYDACHNICPFAHVGVAAPSLIQAMEFSNTLTVDNVYYAIIASGINTKLEECDD